MLPAILHRQRAILSQVARFLGLGLFSFALGAGVTAFLGEVIGVREEIAVAVSLIVLLVTNFWLSARYVFRTSTKVSYVHFVKFSATALIMRGSEYALFLALFSLTALNYIVALAIAMAISSCLKFFLYRGLVFGRRSDT